ncbi:hypothetical protein EW15_0451 [Prochlorococcus sp. MIT 0801]|nr:hypothetical protein EW15_0451 [Prochlorococcus sp. MIT 0801]
MKGDRALLTSLTFNSLAGFEFNWQLSSAHLSPDPIKL